MYHLIAVQRFLQINPFGNINMTNTTNQRHNCETIQSRAKTRQASSKPFDLVSPFTDLWSSCNNMHHQGNIYKFETFTWWDKNLYCPPSKHIQKKSEGWKQMSARQEHESQHWENQCSALFIYFLFKCSTMWSKSSSGFPCRIKNPFLH